MDRMFTDEELGLPAIETEQLWDGSWAAVRGGWDLDCRVGHGRSAAEAADDLRDQEEW